MIQEDGFDRLARDVDDGLLEGRKYDVLLAAREQAAHDGLDLGASEVDAHVRGYDNVRASLRESTHLEHESVAQLGVLTSVAIKDVAWPCPGVDVGVTRTQVALDLFNDRRPSF